MIWLLIFLSALILYGVRFSHFNTDYLGRGITTSIKGFFAVLILLSHMRGYLSLESPSELAYNDMIASVGQLMVAPYFFYSGYGVMESFRHKVGYADSFFRRRILKTLVHFDMAIILFLIVESLMSHVYPIQNYIFCWIGWESVGNSNWFIFDILVVYLLVYIIMQIKKNWGGHLVLFAVMVAIMTSVLWISLILAQRGSWWYSTILCFPAGCFYSNYKQIIDNIFKKNNILWLLTIAFLALFVAVCRVKSNAITVSIETIVFMLLLTILSMKVQIGNTILNWLGINAFAIYILQRLPMNIFAEYQVFGNNLLFAVISIPCVMLLAYIFTKMTDVVDSKWFR